MLRSASAILLLAGGTLAIAQTSGSENRSVSPTPVDHPITAEQRLKWFAYSSFGPPSLAGGVISAGFGTWMNTPHEYSPTWKGFGKRYGMRLTGVVTSNAMEASLGALWGEDPRYHRAASGQPFSSRLMRAVKMSFLAQNGNGGTMFAYGRLMANAGSNFLSNTWREPSESDAQHALMRTGLGILARLSANAFSEFWPSVIGRFRH